ncbi:MAG: hypothetical protein HC850_17805 [Rhodomicrobium sp.]|nr:hypothetical protein [Rhodomicrobium sp.]
MGNRNGPRFALRLAAVASGAALLLPENAAAQTLRWSSGLEYTRGLYGSPLSTEILIATTSARVTFDRWSVGVTVPYVDVTGPGAPFDPFVVSVFAIQPPAEVVPGSFRCCPHRVMRASSIHGSARPRAGSAT